MSSKRDRLKEANLQLKQERINNSETTSVSFIDEVVDQLDKEPEENNVSNKETSQPILKPKEEENVPKKKKTTEKKSSSSVDSAKNKLMAKKKEIRSIRKTIVLTPSMNANIEDLAKKMNVSDNEAINLILEYFFEEED